MKIFSKKAFCYKKLLRFRLLILLTAEIFIKNPSYAKITSTKGQSTPAKDFYEDIFFAAQALEQEGESLLSATEYKRYLFLQNYSEGIHQAEALSALSSFYFNLGNISLSLNYNQQAQNYLLNQTEIEPESKLAEKSLFQNHPCKVFLKELQLMEIKLLELQLQEEVESGLYARLFNYAKSQKWDSSLRLAAWTALIKLEIHKKNWESAKTEFSLLCSDFPHAFSLQEQALFHEIADDAQNFKFKNPRTAVYLSFIPGLGQLYSQNYEDSLNAFVLNGGLIALSVFSLCNLQFQDFILLEANPMLRFYRGNLVNARDECLEWNQNKISSFQNTLSALMEICNENLQ